MYLCASNYMWPNNTCWTKWLFFIFQPPFIWTKKEIRVKSTKLKYKNKGLKLKSIYEYNLHIHPVLWSRMAALWKWQYSCYGKRGAWTSQNALFRQLRSHLGLSEVYGLVAWICVMVSPGFKANSKKIEGRLFQSHPRSYLSSSPHISPSPGLTVWSAAAGALCREGANSIIPRN